MGEAKCRKVNDPNFGRVPKSANYRGLVVSPPIEIDGTSLHVKSSNLDPQELRFALLFWDQLVWPSSRAVHFSSSLDEIYLESVNVLARPDYTFNGDAAQGILRGQIQAYKDRNQAEPGIWALAQGENSLLLKGGLVEEGNGAFVELHRAIPVPAHDVPLAEILEFKEHRRDELNLLRYKLEAFVSGIEKAENKDLALEKCISEVDEACSNLLRLGKEWQCPVHISNLKASFSISPASSIGGMMGWFLGQQHSLPAAAALSTFASLASTIRIDGDFGFRTARMPASPYRYAYRINEELR